MTGGSSTGALDSGLRGNRENNVLTGNAGDNILRGGLGRNTAVFAGPRSDYRLERRGTMTLVEVSVEGRDGTDTIKSIEVLRFSDGETTL